MKACDCLVELCMDSKAVRNKLLFSRMSREEQAAYRRYLDDRVILADNMAAELIAKYTGLSLEEIAAL